MIKTKHNPKISAGCQTLLSLAANNGHDGIAELLLGRGDASPDRPDNSGQTPIFLAASNGHDVIMNLLLERGDISSDRQTNGAKHRSGGRLRTDMREQ